MNYIWEFILKAEEQKIPKEELVFRPAKSYSPYMEMAEQNWNMTEIEEDGIIEINPFYRFYEIFKDFLNINVIESVELRECLFNIIIHFLAENDLKQGLCKQEYYKRFMLKDLENGIFGLEIWKAIKKWKEFEIDSLLDHMICLYKTGTSIELLKDTIKDIFSHSVIYHNQDDPKEILIYLGEKKTKEIQQKIEVILELFCRIDFKVRLYWEYHFGIIGVENTMCLDEMVIY